MRWTEELIKKHRTITKESTIRYNNDHTREHKPECMVAIVPIPFDHCPLKEHIALKKALGFNSKDKWSRPLENLQCNIKREINLIAWPFTQIINRFYLSPLINKFSPIWTAVSQKPLASQQRFYENWWLPNYTRTIYMSENWKINIKVRETNMFITITSNIKHINLCILCILFQNVISFDFKRLIDSLIPILSSSVNHYAGRLLSAFQKMTCYNTCAPK